MSINVGEDTDRIICICPIADRILAEAFTITPSGVFLGSAKASPEASENDALGRAASEPHGTTRTTATRGSPSRAASRHRRRVP